MDLRKGDCLKILPEIDEKSVDLFLLDLPYGQTACKWDSIIDLKEMWVQIKRTMKPNAVIVFFCTTKFGYKLIQSNEKWFRYDLIWEKSRKVGFLSANKMPLRKHENVYVFSDGQDEKGKIAEYSKKVLQYIDKPKSHIKKEIPGADHFFRYSKDNFGICDEDTYKELIEIYKIDKMEGFLEYDQLCNKYNPQMTEGKPYKTKEADLTNSYYRGGEKEYKSIAKENKGDRHPTSILPEFETTILKHNNPPKSLHKTQKPVSLCEWLVKTYSNEGDLVCDFCMGSGTVGIACKNTNRRFLGIEMDDEIFDLAKNRIESHK